MSSLAPELSSAQMSARCELCVARLQPGPPAGAGHGCSWVAGRGVVPRDGSRSGSRGQKEDPMPGLRKRTVVVAAAAGLSLLASGCAGWGGEFVSWSTSVIFVITPVRNPLSSEGARPGLFPWKQIGQFALLNPSADVDQSMDCRPVSIRQLDESFILRTFFKDEPEG